LPEKISILGVRKFAPIVPKVTVSLGPTAVNLNQISYALGPTQAPPSGVAEGVAPAISLFILLQVNPADRLTAFAHSSFGAELTGSTIQISKPPFSPEVGAATVVENILIK
jgi:hypothetical protein